MEIRFFTKVVFNSKDLMKVVKTKKKTYLYRAGKYLLSTARRNLGERPQLKTVEFTNSFGFTQRETIWAHKAKVGHSPYDHTSWKKSFRFGVDEMAEVVDVGAIRGKNGIAPLHEFGGNRRVEWTEWTFKENQKVAHTMSKNVTFGKRETMRPALERSRQYISAFWKGLVTNM